MGKRYEQHSDMCGCERCAAQYERDNPQPVFDAIEDPDYCDYCAQPLGYCTCWEADDYDDGGEE